MRPQKHIVFVISVLLVAMSCNLLSGTGQSSGEDAGPVQEEEVASGEEDATTVEVETPVEPLPPTNTPIPPTDTPTEVPATETPAPVSF